MGTGNPPCKLISSTLEMPLYFIVKYYYDFVLMVYIIIGRHTYRDARALHGQLVMYVLKIYMLVLVIC